MRKSGSQCFWVIRITSLLWAKIIGYLTSIAGIAKASSARLNGKTVRKILLLVINNDDPSQRARGNCLEWQNPIDIILYCILVNNNQISTGCASIYLDPSRNSSVRSSNGQRERRIVVQIIRERYSASINQVGRVETEVGHIRSGSNRNHGGSGRQINWSWRENMWVHILTRSIFLRLRTNTLRSNTRCAHIRGQIESDRRSRCSSVVKEPKSELMRKLLQIQREWGSAAYKKIINKHLMYIAARSP